MKRAYFDLMEFVSMSEIPKSERDLHSLYHFAGCNRHPLRWMVEILSFEEFVSLYREVEKYIEEEL